MAARTNVRYNADSEGSRLTRRLPSSNTNRRGHLMRPIHQPLDTVGLIAGQRPVQRLTRHAVFSAACDTVNPSPITANTA